MPHHLPLIAVTAGDPCGIGPEVILKTARSAASPRRARLVIIGTLAVFARTARRLGLSMPAWQVLPRRPEFAHPLMFLECPMAGPFPPGEASRRSGAASLAYLDRAVSLWRAGVLDGLVTAPVTKWAAGLVQRGFQGQTEYLAQALGAREVAMMFASDRLRVTLATRHVPLARVSRAVDATQLRAAIRLTHLALQRWFGRRHPRLALCGLNPHAGEEGRCGREEQTVMRPVLRALHRQGIRCDGPFAADGFFAEAAFRYDAVVCPYHDQGLIPFKLVARDRGCQLSIGLPLVRTSPDHGSGLDIAGRGVAHPGSMRYALALAIRLARHELRA